MPSAAEDVRAALPPLVLVPEAKEALRCSKRKIHQLIELDELHDVRPVKRRGIPVLISRASIVAYVKRGEGL